MAVDCLWMGKAIISLSLSDSPPDSASADGFQKRSPIRGLGFRLPPLRDNELAALASPVRRPLHAPAKVSAASLWTWFWQTSPSKGCRSPVVHKLDCAYS